LKTGWARVCVEFGNYIVIFDHEPMPQPEQIIAKLKNDQYSSTFDVTEGYWQIPISEENKAYTVFLLIKGYINSRS